MLLFQDFFTFSGFPHIFRINNNNQEQQQKITISKLIRFARLKKKIAYYHRFFTKPSIIVFVIQSVGNALSG